MIGLADIKNGADLEARKKERIYVRVSKDLKLLLEHAAEVSGRNLSEFVVKSAYDAAQKTIKDFARIRLAEQDRDVFLAALSNPPAPNDALKAAAKRYRKLVE